MTIRETFASLPKAGSVKEVPIEGIGTLRFRRISAAEILAMPEEKTSQHIALASCVDEEGTPLFKSVDELTAVIPTVYTAIIRASNGVNLVKLEDALKK